MILHLPGASFAPSSPICSFRLLVTVAKQAGTPLPPIAVGPAPLGDGCIPPSELELEGLNNRVVGRYQYPEKIQGSQSPPIPGLGAPLYCP